MKTGKIYKLYNEHGTYFGSTTKTLNRRLANHKYEAKSKNVSSHILFKNGCDVTIELLEEVEFDDIKELREREAYYIKNLECINKEIPGRTQKEYNLDNKNKISKQQKQYLEKNKDKILQYQKKYNEANKEKIAQYNEANKEKIAQYNKERYQRKKQQAKEVYEFLSHIENSNI